VIFAPTGRLSEIAEACLNVASAGAAPVVEGIASMTRGKGELLHSDNTHGESNRSNRSNRTSREPFRATCLLVLTQIRRIRLFTPQSPTLVVRRIAHDREDLIPRKGLGVLCRSGRAVDDVARARKSLGNGESDEACIGRQDVNCGYE
jgi:hypothetical protein